jgi:hypothetical protein
VHESVGLFKLKKHLSVLQALQKSPTGRTPYQEEKGKKSAFKVKTLHCDLDLSQHSSQTFETFTCLGFTATYDEDFK